MEYILITHHESGDEIHFTVIDCSFEKDINDYRDIKKPTQSDIEDLLEIIYANKVEHLMCQTYVLEDFSKISKYNIVKCINLPELGC